MKCPKCGSGSVSTIGWTTYAERIYLIDGEIEEIKNLDCMESGIFPDAETICDDCKHKGLPKDFETDNCPYDVKHPDDLVKCYLSYASELEECVKTYYESEGDLKTRTDDAIDKLAELIGKYNFLGRKDTNGL